MRRVNVVCVDAGSSTSREDFNAWVEHAAAEGDFTIERLKVAKSEEEKARFIEELREDLNRQ